VNEPLARASTENAIVSRWLGGQSQRGIAQELGVSRWCVARTIRLHREARVADPDVPVNQELPAPLVHRSSKLDAYQSSITQLLERYPNLSAIRVFEELKKQGYDGGYTILRERVKQLRHVPTKPLTIRFETGPGVQAQMDWSVYDLDFTHEGRRRVNLFSYVLGYSRRQYLCFTAQQDFETTVRQHILAFEHLQGVAATCLYDNMKVVVTRWEDEQPIYNTRFLAFATHYGYRPWACRPRRPETKGKVERPFHYVETSLLSGRCFRTLEHLNEVTRWWLTHHADVRIHRTTKKRPLDAHAEEQPHLLPLPTHHYDTARVIYRIVNSDGTVIYGNNHYSVPWRLVGELLPVRVTETELWVYNRHIQQVARHELVPGATGEQRIDPAHRPPANQAQQIDQLRLRFAELGEVASRFLEGLLSKQRCGKHQAARVLGLLGGYHRADLLAAMERALRYHAYSLSALERILSHQATPKTAWQSLSESEQETLRKLSDTPSIEPRSSQDYQYLLFEEHDSDAPDETQRHDDPGTDPPAPGDTQDPDAGGASG
jgi:transposase